MKGSFLKSLLYFLYSLGLGTLHQKKSPRELLSMIFFKKRLFENFKSKHQL